MQRGRSDDPWMSGPAGLSSARRACAACTRGACWRRVFVRVAGRARTHARTCSPRCAERRPRLSARRSRLGPVYSRVHGPRSPSRRRLVVTVEAREYIRERCGRAALPRRTISILAGAFMRTPLCVCTTTHADHAAAPYRLPSISPISSTPGRRGRSACPRRGPFRSPSP